MIIVFSHFILNVVDTFITYYGRNNMLKKTIFFKSILKRKSTTTALTFALINLKSRADIQIAKKYRNHKFIIETTECKTFLILDASKLNNQLFLSCIHSATNFYKCSQLYSG